MGAFTSIQDHDTLAMYVDLSASSSIHTVNLRNRFDPIHGLHNHCHMTGFGATQASLELGFYGDEGILGFGFMDCEGEAYVPSLESMGLEENINDKSSDLKTSTNHINNNNNNFNTTITTSNNNNIKGDNIDENDNHWKWSLEELMEDGSYLFSFP